MFGMFKKSPLKKWSKDHEALLTKAFQAQRDGNIRLYSTLTAEAEALRETIEAFNNSEGAVDGGRSSSL
jgi:hypothetical protein|tara:strand:+ start:21458 stop:21664 length:207 start_codon:yes stop_codon:yes gene_type:complete